MLPADSYLSSMRQGTEKQCPGKGYLEGASYVDPGLCESPIQS